MRKFALLASLLIMMSGASSQNVGIGTPTPAFKLDVQGRMRVKTGTLNNVNTSSGIWFDDYRNGNNQFFFGMKDSIRGGFYGSSVGVGWNLLFNTRSGLFNNDFGINGGIGLYSGSTNHYGGGLRGDSNDLYIGAKTAFADGVVPGNIIMQYADPRTPDVRTGNIGIGVDTPYYKLSLNGNIGLYDASDFIGSISNTGNNMLINSGVGMLIVGSSPNDLILQYASGFGTTAGKVGIGTAAPLGKLHVTGSGELFRAGSTTTAIHMTESYLQFIGASTGKFFMQLIGNNLLFSNSSGNNNGILVLNGNQVTIGQVSPADGYKLSIGGKAICEELKVQLQGGWPDYVFKKNYKLKTLGELRQFIAHNNHLPNIPPAAELEKNGVEVGEMQRKMMEKIEELTLYVLQLEEQINELKKKIDK